MRECETTENRMFLVRVGLRLRIESMSEKRTKPERVSGSYIYRASNIPFHGDTSIGCGLMGFGSGQAHLNDPCMDPNI